MRGVMRTFKQGTHFLIVAGVHDVRVGTRRKSAAVVVPRERAGRVGGVVMVRVEGRITAVWIGARNVKAGSQPWISGVTIAVAHEVFGEERCRVAGPVPVVKRKPIVDLSDHGLKPVQQFAVPCDELWSLVHVRGLVYFILLEPVTHASGRSIGSGAGEEPVV